MLYEILRSSRRTLAIEITRDARVLIRAPRRCGVAEIQRFAASREDWVRKHLAAANERLLAHPEPDKAELAALTRRAQETLPGKVAAYAARMGVAPAGVKITRAKTRFGSCSAKNSICFSCRLMQYPEEAIDYVVVHELAHIRQKNHSKAFYAVVASILPDYQSRKKLLRG